MRRCAVLLLLACLPAAALAQPDPALVAKLRHGGYVLFLRHASTDKGRGEARALGAEMKRLAIPIGPVYASPFCRTRETAQLAFGRYERTDEARGGPANTSDPMRYEPLRRLLTTKPPHRQNAVISSHGNPFFALFGPPYLAEGEMAIVDPLAFVVVGRIRLDDWQVFQ